MFKSFPSNSPPLLPDADPSRLDVGNWGRGQGREQMAFDPRIGAIYRALGVVAAELSQAQGAAGAAALPQLREALADYAGRQHQ